MENSKKGRILSPRWGCLHQSPPVRAQGTVWERRRKRCKSQRGWTTPRKCNENSKYRFLITNVHYIVSRALLRLGMRNSPRAKSPASPSGCEAQTGRRPVCLQWLPSAQGAWAAGKTTPATSRPIYTGLLKSPSCTLKILFTLCQLPKVLLVWDCGFIGIFEDKLLSSGHLPLSLYRHHTQRGCVVLSSVGSDY